ncbi:putative ribosomal large subunit pseudouridine synthase SVR1, chloroplastic isoform X1 [Ricinus communis]|uniref:putative ribosomal large subunit pseudouridine synthase SVR1, chloroplastic isoform X1 n=1 Tax=Ricinus communis TaxID=3988 RepID=UPI00201A28F0|nr:putative ribosomal large subunit pseudouridine synthase SVR1, chloroplastic isoform X1 [Ricinus communis]
MVKLLQTQRSPDFILHFAFQRQKETLEMGSVAALSSLHSIQNLIFSKPSVALLKPIRSLPRITCSSSSSSSSSSLEFNISFAPPKPKPKSPPQLDLSDQEVQLFIPWIVRGEDGNLKLQSHPPARLIHALADAKTHNTKKQNKVKKVAAAAPTPAVKDRHLSKAARRFYNETFREPPQRLSKVLAASGVASRRNSEELIFQGKVTVNGSVCNTPQTRVDPARDVIYVNGNRLPKKLPPKVYLALNKPKGYICSSGEKQSKSVMSLFDDYFKSWDKSNPGLPKPRLFTVGRLDVATTGLIIVTNDGDFAQELAHPSFTLSKEYIATVDGAVNKRHLIAISGGTIIQGVHCTPDSVELLPRQPDLLRPRLRIVVHEGRNHEVRELVKNAGLEVHSLKRVRIGGYRLPSDLGIGKHVELRKSELKLLGWKS